MDQPNDAEFPQHAKVAAFSEDMEIIHTFLHTSGYELCTWNESENAFVPTTKNCGEILDEFFGIDRAALVQEHRVLREELIDLLAREAADDMFEQLGLLVQEENDAPPEAADNPFRQLHLLIKKEKEEDDDTRDSDRD